ncbi:hypothetical protein [Oceanobacillus sp. CFH 90083]|nr:hypothetical protein [Oceanobacillus sp. CFH 90083]
MAFPLGILPVLSIVLLCISAWIALSNVRKRKHLSIAIFHIGRVEP